MIIQRRDIDYTEEGHRLYRGRTSIVQRWDPDEEPRLYRGGISIIQKRDPDYTKEASILQRRDSDEGPRLYRGGTPIIQRRDFDYTEGEFWAIPHYLFSLAVSPPHPISSLGKQSCIKPA